MNKWTERHILGLKKENKIRDYKIPERSKGFSSDKSFHQGTRARSKALDWLEWNLQFFANENALTLEKEYKFCDDRGWRFDFCFPSIKTACEYEGSLFNPNGDHRSVKGISRDVEKYNRAALLGWRVIRLTALNYTTVLSQLNQLIQKHDS